MISCTPSTGEAALPHMTRPDFRTISRFRKENLAAIDRSFAETVRVAMEMGLVLLEHVSVAGAKPNKVSGDGGYFSTETIEYAAAEGIDAYVPDSQVRKSAREGFVYDEERDEFTCPEGAKIEYLLACTGTISARSPGVGSRERRS
jgi:hypothetical protein